MRTTLFIYLVLSIGFGACNKLLEVQSPPAEINVDKAFNDSASALSAVSGIYNGMVLHGFFEYSGLSYFAARSADEAIFHSPPDFFAADSLLYTNKDVQTMWEQGFSSLLMINTCLRGIQLSDRLSTTLHRQLLGEILFCRAFVNFYLVNIWGNAIPLITSPDVDINRTAPSVQQQQVYGQIMADLLKAQELLTNTYPVNYSKGRPNVMAANALLARVYLYQARYGDAVTQATAVIGSNLYTPLARPAVVFVAGNKEAIWQLIPPTNTTGALEPVGDAKLYLLAANSLTPQLLAAFEPGDLRKQAWVVDNTYLGATYTTANKYKRSSSASGTVEYYTALRLAEQYLIRAEANNLLGNTQAAITDLNILRARAGLTDLPMTLTQQKCVLAVEQERRVELFTEWGHRWFDLKRWPGIINTNKSRADEVLGAIKPDWQSTDQWYPVPRSELQLNTYLVQNSGYPTR
jgi:hypothetical protein